METASKFEGKLLSDSDSAAALAFGLAFRMSDEDVKLYKQYGIEVPGGILPVPAAFVLGTDGIVQFNYADPNFKNRIHPEVLLAAAKAALP